MDIRLGGGWVAEGLFPFLSLSSIFLQIHPLFSIVLVGAPLFPNFHPFLFYLTKPPFCVSSSHSLNRSYFFLYVVIDFFFSYTL